MSTEYVTDDGLATINHPSAGLYNFNQVTGGTGVYGEPVKRVPESAVVEVEDDESFSEGPDKECCWCDTWIWVVSILFVLAAGGACVYFLTKHRHGHHSDRYDDDFDTNFSVYNDEFSAQALETMNNSIEEEAEILVLDIDTGVAAGEKVRICDWKSNHGKKSRQSDDFDSSDLDHVKDHHRKHHGHRGDSQIDFEDFDSHKDHHRHHDHHGSSQIDFEDDFSSDSHGRHPQHHHKHHGKHQRHHDSTDFEDRWTDKDSSDFDHHRKRHDSSADFEDRRADKDSSDFDHHRKHHDSSKHFEDKWDKTAFGPKTHHWTHKKDSEFDHHRKHHKEDHDSSFDSNADVTKTIMGKICGTNEDVTFKVGAESLEGSFKSRGRTYNIVRGSKPQTRHGRKDKHHDSKDNTDSEDEVEKSNDKRHHHSSDDDEHSHEDHQDSREDDEKVWDHGKRGSKRG